MISKHQLARDRSALQATLARTGLSGGSSDVSGEMKGAMHQVASQCVEFGGDREKGGQTRKKKRKCVDKAARRTSGAL